MLLLPKLQSSSTSTCCCYCATKKFGTYSRLASSHLLPDCKTLSPAWSRHIDPYYPEKPVWVATFCLLIRAACNSNVGIPPLTSSPRCYRFKDRVSGAGKLIDPTPSSLPSGQRPPAPPAAALGRSLSSACSSVVAVRRKRCLW
jgi:hypothetical protein